MGTVRVPSEWDVTIEARSSVKGTRNWRGVTVAFDINGALDDVPEGALEDDGEEKGPEGHVTHVKIEVTKR